MDCFYAAIETLDRPDLKLQPLAVGGRPENRGVIATCNYEARKFKVHSALSTREALRRCPQLIVLPPRFGKYRQISQEIHQILSQYSDCIEPLSLDEAYLDVSHTALYNGSATLIAKNIRKDIMDKMGLTASAGIANCKFLAKIASDWNKPDGQFTIEPEAIDDFIKKLPVRKIPGVGKATLAKLAKLEIKSCEDLQKLNIDQLNYHFGSFGIRLYDLCRGIDLSPVRSSRQRKSISVESTFSEDIDKWPEILRQAQTLYTELERRIKKAGLEAEDIKSLSVKFKSYDFQISSKEKSLPLSLENFLQLLEDHFLQNPVAIRLLGLGCKLDVKEQKKSRHQLDLF